MRAFCAGAAAVLFAIAAARAEQPVELDVTRVAIFTSGVACFERQAEVDGDATAELSFRTGQINDVLKSMVVQDAGGTVGAVTYPTRDPAERTLKSFAVDLTEKPTLGELIGQLRGEAVEITGPSSVRGVIVGVEYEQTLDHYREPVPLIERVTILTDHGLQSFELLKLQSIKLTNPAVDGELRKALATLASTHDADRKSVRIRFEGQGRRKVSVAYLLEAPVWKCSYRLVLHDGGQPLLQGWANVENTTDSDWNDVRLSLVSGRPVSFQMDLYTPLYLDRPLEKLELFAGLRAPVYGGSGSLFQNQQQGTMTGAESYDSMKEAMRRLRGDVPAAPPPPPAPPAPASADAGEDLRSIIAGDPTGVSAAATGADAGELFAYHIDKPISIPRQQSAMIPIVQKPVDAAKLSVFDVLTHPRHPFNAVQLKNTSGDYLMQGPVTLFDGGVYAGDAILPDLKPEEERLVAYALDLSAEVQVRRPPPKLLGIELPTTIDAPAAERVGKAAKLQQQQAQLQRLAPTIFIEEIVSLSVRKGALVIKRALIDEREYVVANKSDRPKTVIIQQRRPDGWQLVEPREPYQHAADAVRFKVDVPPGKTASQKVRTQSITAQSVMLAERDLDEIEIYFNAKSISPAVRDAVTKVIRVRTEIDELARNMVELERKREAAVADQARIRENLRTLDKSTDAYQRQLKQFDAADAQITGLAGEIDAARASEAAKRTELETYLANLDLD